MSTTTASSAETTASILGIESMSVAAIPRVLDLAAELEPKITPCFVGDTGIGKTPIVQAWAKKNGAACHVLNFGHMQPQDISMMLFAEDAKSCGYVPFDWLLRLNEDAANTERYPGGAVLFVDELNRAPIELLNAMFTLTDERRVHDFHLHDRVLLVGAMNPSSDGHTVNRFERDPAMRKRLAFIHVMEDLNAWIAYAEKDGKAEIVTEFLRTQGETAFYNRALRAAGKVFPTPAAWDKACRIIAADARSSAKISQYAAMLLGGVIGREATAQLVLFESKRAYSPYAVFSASSDAKFNALMRQLKTSPNDPSITAFRVATADWIVMQLGDTGAPRVSKTVADRYGAYLTALQPERRQALISDIGQKIVVVAPRGADQTRYWDRLSQLYTDAGLDDLVSEAAEMLSTHDEVSPAA